MQKNINQKLSEEQLPLFPNNVTDQTLLPFDLVVNQISKKLYDVVDYKAKRGWSLKTVLVDKNTLLPNQEVSFVIQRADIFTKYEQLGFKELTRSTNTLDLGKAIIQLWNNKVENDSEAQGVVDGRLAVLVKNKNRQQYIYIEQPIEKFDFDDFIWAWTDQKRRGLQAKRKLDGKVMLRWYGSGTQLFQTITIPQVPLEINLIPKRATVDKFVESVLKSLD